MKTLGLLLLAAGVIVCASASVQLGEREASTLAEAGRVALSGAPAGGPSAPPTTPSTRIEQWFDVAGVPFAGGLVLLVVGAVLGRVAISRDGAGAGTGTNGADFAAALDRLNAGIRELKLVLDAPGADAEQVRHQIEQLQQDALEPVIEARATLQRHLGLAGYAAVLGPLSGAERLLNRTWSALVDGHVPEGRESLASAAEQAELARSALESLG